MKCIFLKTESDSLNSDGSDDDSHRFGGNKNVPHNYFMIKSRGGIFWSIRPETDNRERALSLPPAIHIPSHPTFARPKRHKETCIPARKQWKYVVHGVNQAFPEKRDMRFCE
jgi:hypothetical protein